MKKQSAGILVYRRKGNTVEVLLGHSGGPFWEKKNKSAWSIPKGEVDEGEDLFATAKREFKEELGKNAPEGDYLDLGMSRATSKDIYVWAVKGDFDVSIIQSNTFEVEWPPHSGNSQKFPEIDAAKWFDVTKVGDKLPKAQQVFLDRLTEALGIETAPEQQSLL